MDEEIRDLEAAHFQALVAMGQATIPVSIRDEEESWAGWPQRRPGTGPGDADDFEPDCYGGGDE